jgi:hypothetical protein
MDNPMYTSVCHDSQGPPAWCRDWRSDCLQEPHCGAVICTACYCGGRGHRRHVPTCMHYCNAVRTPSTSARHTVGTSRCCGRCWWRTASPHRRQAGTSNLLMHDDMRATKAIRSIGSRGAAPGGVEIDLPGGSAVEGSRRLQGLEKKHKLWLPYRKNILCIIVGGIALCLSVGIYRVQVS